MSELGALVAGCLLCDRLSEGNLIGSLTKNTGCVECKQSVIYFIECARTFDSKTHRIIEHPVKVTFICVQLHRPTMYIPCCIGGSAFRANGRYAKEHLRRFPNRVKKASRGEISAVMGDFKFAVGANLSELLGVSVASS